MSAEFGLNSEAFEWKTLRGGGVADRNEDGRRDWATERDEDDADENHPEDAADDEENDEEHHQNSLITF